jgi:hypothetical protein|tara:strand:+ start:680 stop:1576 length:897 start_codon:yes stop_codon:yes gene_type:complete
MNQYIKILLFSILVFSGCEDESENFVVSKVPDTFTKKVLIEEFTGAWCGYCPDGADRVKRLINDNDGRVVGVSIHAGNPTGDAMVIAHANYLETTYQSTSFPSAMVDRVSINGNSCLNRGYWASVTNNQLLETTVCGLAIISEINGQNATVEVHAGFSSNLPLLGMDGLVDDYRLTVYLIEDGVTEEGYGYDQRNYDNTIEESPFYNLGDPIIGYEHNQTLRAVLSDSLGDVIVGGDDSYIEMKKGEEYIKTYTVDISSYNKKNLSIVAFITHIGSIITEHEVMNVQQSDIDGFQDWD